MITRANYEEYIMMYVDGELKPAEEAALQDFIARNPDLKKELEAFQLTKLQTYDEVVFAGKESLIKKPVKRVIVFPQWIKYGVAAAVVVMFSMFLFRFLNTDKNTEVAKTNVITEQQHEEKKIVQEQQTPQTNTPVAIVKNDTVIPAPIVHQPIKNVVVKNSVRQQRNIVILEENSTTKAVATIDKIETHAINTLAENRPESLAPSAIDVPAYNIAVSAEEKKTFWDKLPIDDLKKQKMDNIGNDIKNELDGKSLSVKFEKRTLVLSFN